MIKLFLLLIIQSILSFNTYAIEDCGNLNGVALPCWRTFLRQNEGDESLPYYPYAKRANGCSFLNQRPGESDILTIENDQYDFKDSCNFHDRCYYTLNSDEHVCNQIFLNRMTSMCESSGSDETRVWCMARAKIFFEAVKTSSAVVHRYSQVLENLYLNRVEHFVLMSKK